MESPNTSQVADQQPPAAVEESLDARDLTLRRFAWFPLRSAAVIADPAERGRQAWAEVLRSLVSRA